MALSKRLRYEILRRDNFTCRACGAKADNAPLTVDHVLPRSLGGTDQPSNLQTLCLPCNAGKGSSHPNGQLLDDVIDDVTVHIERARAAAAAEAQTDELVSELLHSFPGDVRARRAITAAVRPWIRLGVAFEHTRTVMLLAVEITDEQEPAPDDRLAYTCAVARNVLSDIEANVAASRRAHELAAAGGGA